VEVAALLFAAKKCDGRSHGKRQPGRIPQRPQSKMQRHERRRSAIALTEQSARLAHHHGRNRGASLFSFGGRYAAVILPLFPR
jgi:hypothetical protein